MKRYDLIVIGSGGGARIATSASHLGYKVALIEKWKTGGTCLNRGCIPSKMLIHPANIAKIIKESKKFDIDSKINHVNFSKIIKRITHIVDSESEIIKKHFNKNIDYYHCEARFISNKVLLVNGKKITADKIFIATGAIPSIPPIPGLKDTPYMTSTEALRNTKLPEKLIVIGGGYIGCELGHAYASLGSEVHFLVMGDELLQREDIDIRKEFTRKFAEQYHVHFNANTKKIEYNNNFIITVEDNKSNTEKITGDALLIATGIKPNSDLLGLENTKIEVNDKGYIKVNKYLETTVPGVYALGDVIGRYMFRHAVNFEAEFLFRTLFLEKKKKPIKYPPMPNAVFSNPEIGSVGKTEDELIEEGKVKGKDYIVGLSYYKDCAMGMARLSEHEFVKLLFDKKTKKLIGAHILGEEASTMIHQLIHAMTFNATVHDLLSIIYIHPALPEVIRNAVRKAEREF